MVTNFSRSYPPLQRSHIRYHLAAALPAPLQAGKGPGPGRALSGHKEVSKAFARYREIDEDMKRDLVSMLE